MGNSNSNSGEEEPGKDTNNKREIVDLENEDVYPEKDRKASLAYSSPDEHIDFKVASDKAASSDSSFANIEVEEEEEDDENDVTITEDYVIEDDRNLPGTSYDVRERDKRIVGLNEIEIKESAGHSFIATGGHNSSHLNKQETNKNVEKDVKVKQRPINGVRSSSVDLVQAHSSVKQDHESTNFHYHHNKNKVLNEESMDRSHQNFINQSNPKSDNESFSAQGITENEVTDSESESQSSDSTLTSNNDGHSSEESKDTETESKSYEATVNATSYSQTSGPSRDTEQKIKQSKSIVKNTNESQMHSSEITPNVTEKNETEQNETTMSSKIKMLFSKLTSNTAENKSEEVQATESGPGDTSFSEKDKNQLSKTNVERLNAVTSEIKPDEDSPSNKNYKNKHSKAKSTESSYSVTSSISSDESSPSFINNQNMHSKAESNYHYSVTSSISSETAASSDTDDVSEPKSKRKDRHLSLKNMNTSVNKKNHRLRIQAARKRLEMSKEHKLKQNEMDNPSSRNQEEYLYDTSDCASSTSVELDRINRGANTGHSDTSQSQILENIDYITNQSHNQVQRDSIDQDTPMKPPRRKKKHKTVSKEQNKSDVKVYSTVTGNRDSKVKHYSHNNESETDQVLINTTDREINVKTSISITNEKTMQMGINIEISPQPDGQNERIGNVEGINSEIISTESIEFNSISLRDEESYNESLSLPKSLDLDYDENGIMFSDSNAQTDSEVTSALHDISKNFVSGCVESSYINQDKIEHVGDYNENSAYLGTLRQLSDEGSDHNSQHYHKKNQHRTFNSKSHKVDPEDMAKGYIPSSSSSALNTHRDRINNRSSALSGLDLEHLTGTSSQVGDNTRDDTMAGRPLLSFSSLVSGQTLGDEDLYKSVKPRPPPTSELLDSAASSRNNSETDSPNLARKNSAKSGSKKKGRSRRSRRLPPQAQEYWQEYLSKYNNMGPNEFADDENLRDITNIGSLKNLGNTPKDRGNITTFFNGRNDVTDTYMAKNSANSVGVEQDINDNNNTNDKLIPNYQCLKETGITSLESAKCKFTQQRNQYVHKDLQSCQSVCSKANVISHWSSNMNLPSDSQLINDDSEIIKPSKDKDDISSDPNNKHTSTTIKNSVIKEDDSSLLLLLKEKNTSVYEGNRNENIDERNSVLKSLHRDKYTIEKDRHDQSMILVNDPRENIRKQASLTEDVDYYVKHDTSSPGLERTGSPGSVRRSLRNKPPSGAKTKNPISSNKIMKFGLNPDEMKSENVGLQLDGADHSVKQLESRMLKTLISSTHNKPTMSNPEDGNYATPSFSRSWSAQDFRQVDDVSGSQSQIGLDPEYMDNDSRKGQGRRTISDLGFTYSRPGPSRTAALLKNPVMRKHLARTMGLGAEASEEDIRDAIDERLEVTMKRSNLSRSTSAMSLCSNQGFDGERGSYSRSSLQRTTSLSSGFNTSMGDVSEISQDRQFTSFKDKSHTNDNYESKAGRVPERDNAFTDSIFANKNKDSLPEPVVMRRRVQSASAKFHIPSFNDFKRSRKMGTLKMRPASASFDCIASQTIPEEEQQEERINGLNKTRSMSFDVAGHDLTRVKNHSSLRDIHTSHIETDNDERIGKSYRESDNVHSKHQQVLSSQQPSVKSKHHQNHSDNDKPCDNKQIKHKSITNQKPTGEIVNCDNNSTHDNQKLHISTKRGHHRSSKDDINTRTISPDAAFSEELEGVLLESESASPSKFRDEITEMHVLSASKKKRKMEKKLARKKMLLDSEGVINRSTSDVSDIYAEEERKKLLKDKRHKPYKSDPFGKVHRKYLDHSVAGLEGDDIKDELLNLVKDVQSCSLQSLESNLTASSVPSVDSCLDEISDDDKPPPVPPRRRKSKRKKKRKVSSSDSEVFRADSGVGAETFGLQKIDFDCKDCNTQVTEDNVERDPDGEILEVCQKCHKHRRERIRIINEILTSEQSYGKDLHIVYDEFYKPMQANGLLNQDQLYTVFINLEELISINSHFVKQLQDVIQTANKDKDPGGDCLDVRVGKLFLQASNMLLAFETYCIDHSEALVTLEALEKEREILRIFLEVSQAENSALRRMHLKAFLVIPVQRIMKYPLLLNRLYKVTPSGQQDRDSIKVAKRKIEDILEHINYSLELKDKNSELSQAVQILKTKGTASMRLKKKFFVQQMLKNAAVYEDIEIHKVAMDTVGWSKNEVNIVFSSKILYSLMPDANATKRGKMVKYSPVHGVLITLGKGPTWETKHDPSSSVLFTTKYTEVKQCALVLLKEKSGTYVPSRETFYLDKCIVAMDDDIPEVFEMQEMTKNSESFIFKSTDHRDTVIWYNHLKFQCRDLGKWRKRRNALPNIMITLGKS